MNTQPSVSPPKIKLLMAAAFHLGRTRAFARRALEFSQEDDRRRADWNGEGVLIIPRSEWDKFVLKDALETAIRTAYSVSFKTNQIPGLSASEAKLDASYLTQESAGILNLHSRLLSERDKAFSHSDAAHFRAEITIADNQQSEYHQFPNSLTSVELEQLIGLCDRLLDRVAERKNALMDTLAHGKY